jgi:hypothetical protein
MSTEFLIRQKIKALNGARYELENGGALTLCNALSNTLNGPHPKNVHIPVQWWNETYKQGVRELTSYMRAAIKPHRDLSGWLKANGMPGDYVSTFKARFSWLEWMWLCLKEDLAELESAKSEAVT